MINSQNREMMKLKSYPDAIAVVAEAVNSLDLRVAVLHREIARHEGQAERVVAFETHLKNEDQRKARRFQLLQENLQYQKAQETLLEVIAERANATAQLDRLRDRFNVAKLEARLAIADKLAGLDSRELVGL